MVRRMPRSIPPQTTASGDAVIVEATGESSGRDSTRGRLLAQLEHNAMLALGLVRAGFNGLQGVTLLLERATQTIPHNQVVLDPGKTRELKRLLDELIEHVRTSAYAEHVLLLGASVSFALDDPWLEASELFFVKLPDLTASVLGPDGLARLELESRTSSAHVMLRINGVRSSVAQGHVSLQHTVRRLNVVVLRLHAKRGKSSPAPPSPDDFQRLTGRVRDHVLRSGASALRVQGTPSTRAASLVEGSEDAV
jgi:hypothetical protein